MKAFLRLMVVLAVIGMMAGPVSADSFFFSTGAPDGKMATASRPGSAGVLETESADDFVLTSATSLSNATFTGLLPAGPASVLVDCAVAGQPTLAARVAARLTATLNASGRECVRLRVPRRDGNPEDSGVPARAIWLADGSGWRQVRSWDVVIWLRTAPGGRRDPENCHDGDRHDSEDERGASRPARRACHVEQLRGQVAGDVGAGRPDSIAKRRQCPAGTAADVDDHAAAGDSGLGDGGGVPRQVIAELGVPAGCPGREERAGLGEVPLPAGRERRGDATDYRPVRVVQVDDDGGPVLAIVAVPVVAISRAAAAAGRCAQPDHHVPGPDLAPA